MSFNLDFKPEQLNQFFPPESQLIYVERLRRRNQMTSHRAKCFIRLWAYLWLKEQHRLGRQIKKPIDKLNVPRGAVPCSCREAATLFYFDGDERKEPESSARMMLNLLSKLRLIKKERDGHTLSFMIVPIPEISDLDGKKPIVGIDQFDVLCDVIPVANLLAVNYKQMFPSTGEQASRIAHRISELLRKWSEQYSKGMRVLRRSDNDNIVGFYFFYPVKSESEEKFVDMPHKGLHLSIISKDVDPFKLAVPGEECQSIFIRSWIIAPRFRDEMQSLFLKDAQKTLRKMRKDFPKLHNLYTLIIHPSYEPLLHYLGFQKMINDSSESIYWTYLALDRFLKKKIHEKLPFRSGSPDLVQ